MIYRLKPIFIERSWGGTHLSEIYNEPNKRIAVSKLLSAFGNYENEVEGTGKTLKELFEENPEIVAKGYSKKVFPLQVKLVDDESKQFSIQNHPEGKTEFWHILEAKKDAFVYVGLKEDLTKEELRKYILDGTICDHLNKVRARTGDCFLIKPGTIHAIGKGILLVEVEESLDTTYRLFAFQKTEEDGPVKEIHLEEGLNAARLDQYQVDRMYRNVEGELIRCRFVSVKRHRIFGSEFFYADERSFHYIVVLSGEGKLISKRKEYPLNEADSIFVTACHGSYSIEGDVEFLDITL